MIKLAVVPLVLLTLSGCASYTITKDGLAQHFKENQLPQETTILSRVPATMPGAILLVIPSIICSSTYQSNGIKKIPCLNSNGERVFLYPDHNTQLEITSKSSKEVITMYFDTVLLAENKLVGLRSRLISCMIREIALDDIEKIEIYAEFPKTEKVEGK
jgi:hypothetical protein